MPASLLVTGQHLLNSPPQYKGDLLNEAFAVELFDWVESSNINYWVYGHHHSNTPDLVLEKPSLLPINWAMYKGMGTRCLSAVYCD